MPSRYILHTVEPIVYGKLTDDDCILLTDCYHSCLTLATEKRLSSIAFCCISTGEFHFPNQTAAQIAIKTVEEFLCNNHTIEKVVFNVFKDQNFTIYKNLLYK